MVLEAYEGVGTTDTLRIMKALKVERQELWEAVNVVIPK